LLPVGLPFDLIFEQNPAITAKPVQLPVHIPDGAAVVHNAGSIRAVTEIEGVAQLMHGLFDDTALVGFRIGRETEAFTEPVGGDDAGFSAQLGFSIDVGEDGDEKVHSRDGQNLGPLVGQQSSQLFQNGGGMDLIPHRVRDEVFLLKKGENTAGKAKYMLDFCADPGEEGIIEAQVTDG
jgi:hypothetical protein